MATVIQDGTIYYCDGRYYWWRNGSFHYKVNKKDCVWRGMRLNDIPEWGAVCNVKTEEYIKRNCNPSFDEESPK